MSNFLKDLIYVGFSKVLVIFFTVSVSVITARYLGPEKNGIIAALLVYPTLFMTVGSLGIRQSTTYFLGKKIFTEDVIKKAITQIWFLSSILCVIICFFLMYYLSNSSQNPLWISLALLSIPFSLFNTYNSGIFLGKNQIGSFNKINWFPPLIIFVLTLTLVIVFNMGISGYLIALIGGPLFMFFVLLFKNDFLGSFSFNIDWLVVKQMLSLGLVYALSLLIISLNYRVDIILLDRLSNSFEMGIYSKGANLIEILWQIPMVLNTLIFARSAVSKNDFLFSIKVAQLLRLSLVLVLVASLILFLFSGTIVKFLLGSEFAESAKVLKILLPGVVFLILFKVMNMDLAGKGKPWVSMKAMLPALIINIICNIIFIPKYGAGGASFASTISYTIAGVLFIYFYSKEVKIPISRLLTYHKTDFKPIADIIKKIKRSNK